MGGKEAVSSGNIRACLPLICKFHLFFPAELQSPFFEPPRTPRTPRTWLRPANFQDFLLGALGVLGGLFSFLLTLQFSCSEESRSWYFLA